MWYWLWKVTLAMIWRVDGAGYESRRKISWQKIFLRDDGRLDYDNRNKDAEKTAASV